MDDSFELPVIFKGEQLHFKAWLIVYGYSHKFKVMVNEMEILFEPDDEGNYRALSGAGNPIEKSVDIALLKVIVETIQSLVK